jgi:DNA-binding transcriptional LysR family regulator
MLCATITNLRANMVGSVELVDLQYFVAVVDAGGLARVAQSNAVDTSTVSRRIGRLEDELGVTLFERNRTGVRLTAGGEAVLRHAWHALKEIDRSARVSADRASGRPRGAFRHKGPPRNKRIRTVAKTQE